MFDEAERPKKAKILKKITKQRLKNIALYYLRRFESSVDNLRRVLQKRVNDYAFQNKDFDKSEAYGWIEEILNDYERLGYVSDERFTDVRIRDYMRAGKSALYIKNKLRQKGIGEEAVSSALEEVAYDEYETAMIFARKKRIGCFRPDPESRLANRQKDMAALARAGFSFDVAERVVNNTFDAEFQS